MRSFECIGCVTCKSSEFSKQKLSWMLTSMLCSYFHLECQDEEHGLYFKLEKLFDIMEQENSR